MTMRTDYDAPGITQRRAALSMRLRAAMCMHPCARWAVAMAAVATLWAAGAGMELGMGGVARAVEFASPPGIDVARQEEDLREEVLRNAKDLLGPGLVNVLVTINYARTEGGGKGERVKLPGFDRYITIGDENELGIKAEFMRLRQVTIVVDDKLADDVERIERELNAQGKFVRTKGDNLKVVTLSNAGALTGGPGAAGQGGRGKDKFARRPKRRRLGGEPTNEPESTIYLLRARTAYFKEDYNRALDHILKAIEVEPRSAQAYAMLGSLYFTINWKNLAVKYWEMSLELDPENRELDDLVASIKNSN